MKAVFIEEFGTDIKLGLREVQVPPRPGSGEVLVRVRAAGLNRADLLQVRGAYPPPAGYSANIPGLEFAGEIEAFGDGVSNWKVGDRVFGITAGEGQAEYIVSDARLLMPIPDRLGFVEAACVPEAFVTAHDAIVTLGGLEPKQHLLIHAVGSGVGLAALQIAKSRDALVVGTSRTADKLDRCREFGLDTGVVVSDPGDFSTRVLEATSGLGANVILDLVGGAYISESLKSLSPRGRLILVGLTSGRSAEIDLGMILQKRANVIGTVLRPRPLGEKALATRLFAGDVLPLLADGSLVPNLDRAFPAAEVREAYRYLGSNESFGKVVLEF